MKKIISLLIIATLGFSNVRNFNTYELGSGQNHLLIIGGIHGDEPGGYFAPALFSQHYKVTKGKVSVVPNLNFDSIVRNQRGVYGDMNRKFGEIKKSDKDYKNVTRIKEMMLQKDVDFIINLHDGRGYYRHSWESSIFNPRAWGQAYIIDQKSIDDIPFGNLDEVTNAMVSALNRSELKKTHHSFSVKNTFTREKDEQMQMSLTFFAISHLKPALAVETSKNITELHTKVLYQLQSIEALMGYMGITYERDFELNSKEVERLLAEFGTLKINDNITLPLDDIKSAIFFLPLQTKQNEFKFSHPLGTVVEGEKYTRVMIGNKAVVDMYHQKFDSTCEISEVEFEVDGATKSVHVGDVLNVKNSFKVVKNSDFRTNVIGFVTKDKLSQDDIEVKKEDILSRFSVDKSQNIYRVEFYKEDIFCGAVLVEFKNASN